MERLEAQRARKKEAEDRAGYFLSLLSIDQVQQVATHFRAVTGSPHSHRNRHYIKAGRAAFLAICFGSKHLPKDIARYFAESIKR